MLQEAIQAKLARFQDPYLNQDWQSAKVIFTVNIKPESIQIDVVLGYPHKSVKQTLIQALIAWLNLKDYQIEINLSSQIESHGGKPTALALPNIKNMIAIASGKGGVGKSTIATNLAFALAKAGAKVGIFDADIYGPSQPTLLNSQGERPVMKNKRFQPLIKSGLQSISIGNLIEPKASLMWRGPMLGKVIQQMLYDTDWDALDYLIFDLPPGTGDVQLTLCQKMPLSGAVLVTTPQDLALADVKRAATMFNQLDIPILGVIENMSLYHCAQCGHEEAIFGEGGAKRLADELHLNLLKQIPLHKTIRELSDRGLSLINDLPDSLHATLYMEAAIQIAAQLSLESISRNQEQGAA